MTRIFIVIQVSFLFLISCDSSVNSEKNGDNDSSFIKNDSDNELQDSDNDPVNNETGIVINEISVSSDWIELFNSGEKSVDLSGWKIKDNDDKHEYQIPDRTVLKKGAFILFRKDFSFSFGLGKEDSVRLYTKNNERADSISWIRNDIVPETSFGRIPSGTGNFKTLYNITEGAVNIDNIPVTIKSPVKGSSFYAGDRVNFEGNALDLSGKEISGIFLIWNSDIDGKIGSGNTFSTNTLTTNEHLIYLSATDENGIKGGAEITISVSKLPEIIQNSSELFITEFLASNKSINLDPDFNNFSDWIEIYNAGKTGKDISGYFLSDDTNNLKKWKIPADTIIKSNSYLLFWADSTGKTTHAAFKLDSDGESITLSDTAGNVLSSIVFPAQIDDVSCGTIKETPDKLFYFPEPTPGTPNTTEAFPSSLQAPVIKFSLDSGIYAQTQKITLSTSDEKSEIFYSTDGSYPSKKSNKYTAPVEISKTTALKARAYLPETLPGSISTASYIIEKKKSLPFISIVTDPDNLWNDDSGIYVEENIAERKNWTRPAFIEFIEENGGSGFSVESEIRLFGNSAYVYPQKSFAVEGSVDYQIFPDKPFSGFSSFAIRSGSDDWFSSLFRDGFVHLLMKDIIDYQAFRPVEVFINGEYFGIYFLMEKINKNNIISNHDLASGNIDLIYFDHRRKLVEALEGSAATINEILAFMKEKDMTLTENYDYIKSIIDIDDYINNIAVEAYSANTSWTHNIKTWRSNDPPSLYKWLIYDLDRAFSDKNHNTLLDIIQKEPLFGKLIKNKEFREKFTLKYTEIIDNVFETEKVLSLVEEMRNSIAAEMPDQIQRWKDSCYEDKCGIPSMEFWEQEIEIIRDFAKDRPAIAKKHLEDIINSY